MSDQADNLRKMTEVSGNIRSAILKPVDVKARVITITSGKGGVGKTNFTVNLALSLAKQGKKVLVIDADLGLSNVDVVLGASPTSNLAQMIHNGYAISDIVADGPLGIKFISGGSGIYELSNLSDAQLYYFLNQFAQFDDWADIILIDTGAGLNRNVLSFIMAADEVIIITTPEPTSVTDAYAMVKTYASHRGRSPVHLVVNRVRELSEGEGVVHKLTKVTQRFLGFSMTHLGFIFEDRQLQKAVAAQVPLLISFPDSIAARCIERIAHTLIFGEAMPAPGGIRRFFQRFLSRG